MIQSKVGNIDTGMKKQKQKQKPRWWKGPSPWKNRQVNEKHVAKVGLLEAKHSSENIAKICTSIVLFLQTHCSLLHKEGAQGKEH